jgi:hypothetical protein
MYDCYEARKSGFMQFGVVVMMLMPGFGRTDSGKNDEQHRHHRLTCSSRDAEGIHSFNHSP